METQINPQKSKLNPGFFFLCLGVLITLITSVVSFLNLIFGTLDKQFPDVLNSNYQYGYSTYDYEAIRMALATLIIFFPVFLLISYFWKKYSRGEMGHIDEIINKWVMYLILFLSAIVVVVDLVTLVKYFVSGEITNRFILKIIITLVTAVLVGGYYFLQFRIKKDSPSKINLIFFITVIIIFIASIWYSFSIIGSPTTQRLLRLDDRRVSDLQSIQYQVINYWQQKEKLPESLDILANPLIGYSLPVEPEFEKGKKYEFIIKDKNKLTFELCADFSLPMPKGWNEYQNYNGGGIVAPMVATDVATSPSSYPIPIGGSNESLDHQVGRTCFERTIDKDIYPPYPKVLKN